MTVHEPELDFTEEEIKILLENLDQYSDEEVAEIYRIAEELETREYVDAAYNDLIAFCKHMQPDYIVGKHHKILARLLMDIEKGTEDRICVNIPPRHGKSQLVSIYFPAWFLGRNPTKKIMMVSHTTDLAVDFGRKVRNLLAQESYKEIFPDTALAIDSKSAGRWNTSKGGEYYACGVGSSIAGRGADLLLIDDPHSEQDVLNGNFEVFEKAYNWLTFGARTRLMPGGRIAIIQCMTGDTGVLRPDGTETLLRDIRPGDEVATYDNGKLGVARVLNHTSSGKDYVYAIKMTSGTIVRANERHPFLVERNGVRQWVRLKYLQPNETVVRIALDSGEAKYVNTKGVENLFIRDTYANPITEKNIVQRLKPVVAALLSAIHKKGKSVQFRGATNPLIVKSYASHITGKNITHGGIRNAAGIRTGMHTSCTGMVLLWKSITTFWRNKMAGVLSVMNPLQNTTPVPIGVINSVSITATTGTTCGRSYVTTATLPSGIQKPKRQPSQLQNTSDFILDQIVEIVPDGYEEVFDVEIDKTENFIANGIVSHNTRWHMDDLTGRVVRDMTHNTDADEYHVVEFPAVMEVEREVNGELQKVERPLWPEFFDLEALKRTKASMPLFQWNAQYQQKPTAEEAALIKREWWGSWGHEKPPSCEYVIMSLDAAAETHNRADFTAITTWGVFFNEETSAYNIILLNSIKERFEFPELKRKAMEEYEHWEPDTFIVEKKSAGTALYQEMRRMGIGVQEYTPHRGSGDKLARLNSVTDIVASGLVWVPQTRWAEELVEEIAAFPFGSHDDLVDSTVMALMRFRQGGFIRLPSDEPDETRYFKRRGKGFY